MTQIIKTALHCLREELDKKNLGFHHPKPRRLLEPQWSGRSLPYVLYRVGIFIYFFIIIVYDGVSYEFGYKWFIYLTDWFYIVLTLQALLLAFAVTFHYERAKRAQPGEAIYQSLAWPLKVLWFIQNMCLSGALLITLVYWGWTIYEEVDTIIDLPNVTAHGLISLYALVDSFITGIPVRLLHFYQPPLLGVSYALFTWVYWACSGTSPEGNPYIYSAMDYSQGPGKAAGLTGMLCLLSVFLHVCMWVLYRVRLLVFSTRCCGVCCAPHGPWDKEEELPLPGQETQQLRESTDISELQRQRGEKCLLEDVEVTEVSEENCQSGRKCLLDVTVSQV